MTPPSSVTVRTGAGIIYIYMIYIYIYGRAIVLIWGQGLNVYSK